MPSDSYEINGNYLGKCQKYPSLPRWSGKKLRFRPGKPVEVREFRVQDTMTTLIQNPILASIVLTRLLCSGGERRGSVQRRKFQQSDGLPSG